MFAAAVRARNNVLCIVSTVYLQNFLDRFRTGLVKRAEMVEVQTRRLHELLTPLQVCRMCSMLYTCEFTTNVFGYQSVQYYLWVEENRQALLSGMSDMRKLCATCREHDAERNAMAAAAAASEAPAPATISSQQVVDLLARPPHAISQQDMNSLMPNDRKLV